MANSHSPPVDKRAAGFADSLRLFVFSALAILVSVISACGSGYVAFAAVASVRWHGAENFANLALFVFGIPTLMVQGIVFLPLTYLFSSSIKSAVGESSARSILYFAILMPVVTLTAIVAGIALTKSR